MSTRKNKRRWIIFLGVPLLWGLLHLLFRPKPATRPRLIAHRGAAGLAPENTLLAIHEGLMHHADIIEVDVRRSADGTLLLMHDNTVERTTNGAGVVADLPWADLHRLDAGSHFSVHCSHEVVPSLEEALTLLKNETTTLMIEVKAPLTAPGIAEQLVTMIRQFRMSQRVIVTSFDHEWVAYFHSLAPEIPVGLCTVWPLAHPRVLSARTINLFWPAVILDPTVVHRLHTAGHLVYVYSVNNPQLMCWLLALGVDGIITDRPDLWSHL